MYMSAQAAVRCSCASMDTPTAAHVDALNKLMFGAWQFIGWLGCKQLFCSTLRLMAAQRFTNILNAASTTAD